MPDAPTLHDVLYVVSRFPSVRTTFITHEMTAIQAHAVTVHVAAVWRSLDCAHPHAIERPFLDRLHALHLAQGRLWLRAFQQLVMHPGVWLLLVRLTLAHSLSMYALLKLFASIPKGLYLGWWAKQQHIDHIHAHFLTSPTTVALIASRVSGIPYTATAHAFDIFETRPHLKNRGVSLKCNAAAFVVMISEFNKQFVRQRWPAIRTPFEVVYNGIDLAQFAPCVHKPVSPSIQVLSVGQLVPKKGHADLIRAVACLIARGYAVELTIIGEGPLSRSLRGDIVALGVSEHVHLVGKLSQAQVRDYFCRSDIFALASVIAPGGDMDGLPTVLIEALAMGLPTVSTALSGIPEIIVTGETGYCVPPGDSVALAEAIVRVIDDPTQAAAFAARGRAWVAERFDRRHNAARLVQLWHSLQT